MGPLRSPPLPSPPPRTRRTASPPAGPVAGAAAQGNPDHTAGERHKHGMVLLIQLQTQDPPVLLPLDITPEVGREAGREGV